MANSPRKIILNFIKATKGDQKAGAKYYKREWANDRWKYWYNKESSRRDKANQKPVETNEPNLFQKIAGFFKTDPDQAKSIPKAEYESHGIQDKGITLPEWTSHFAKYFQRKSEFDAKFGQEKLTKEQNSEIIDKNQSPLVEKEVSPQTEGKTVYKKSIFRTLYELYGDKNGSDSDTGRTLPGNTETGLSSTQELSGSVDLRESGRDLPSGRKEDNSGESPTLLGNSEPGPGHDVLGSERLNSQQAANPDALSQAMLGNDNAKKDTPTFQLEQEQAPEPKGFQKENNLFGITPQTEGKFLNQATRPPLLNKNIKSLSDFVSSVKDSLLSEGLDKKAEQWVYNAYEKGDSNFSELIEKSKEFVILSDDDETSLRSQIKGNPTVEKQELLDKNLETVKERFSQKKQFEINKKCREILSSTSPNKITDEQKAILRQYEGAGGQATNESAEAERGMLYQFFTPRKMISKVQDIMSRYLKEGDSGLEPSAGIGRFAEGEGSKYNWDMLEYNPDDNTAFQIARILHPDANVSDKAFETLFVDSKNRSVGENYKGKKYQFISGNPPYGAMSGKFKAIEGKGWNRYEHYFINRGLDTLEEGGTMFYVVPSTFLQAGETTWKKKIFGKAELLEAYRMPEGSFGNTAIGVDVIVLRKNTTGTQDNTNAFNGKYFEQKPEHVFGETLERTNRFGKLENYVKGKADAFYEMNLPAPKEMSQAQKDAISQGLMGNDNAKGKRKLEIADETKKVNKRAVKKQQVIDSIKEKVTSDAQKIETYTQAEFNQKFNKKFTEKDLELVKKTSPTGIIDESMSFDTDTMALLPGGARTPLYLYKAGNIKQKLFELENAKEEIIASQGQAQFAKQKKLLESVLPKKIGIEKITLTPIEPFAKGMVFEDEDGNETTLVQKFKNWVRGVPKETGYGRNKKIRYEGGLDPSILDGYSITLDDIIAYVEGVKVSGKNQVINGEKQDTNKQRKEERKETGNKLFVEFMREVLDKEDKEALEDEWNNRFNVNAKLDGKEIPVILEGMAKTYKGKVQDPRDIQMEFVSEFMAKGVGCATHEVGLGKTWTGMMCTVSTMQAGRSKKPLHVVPTSVLQKWYLEFQARFPGVPVQMVGTPQLNKIVKEQDGKFIPPDGTVTIMSYDAFETFGFTEDNYQKLIKDVKDQITDPREALGKDDKISTRILAKQDELASSKMSLAIKGTSDKLNFDEAGFDYLCVDEAHNFNNIFVDQESGKNRFKAGDEKDGLVLDDEDSKAVNEYDGLVGGKPSSRGWKFWLASQWIQKQNDNRNVLLLTATPFTNNPLQVYSLLSAIAKEKLEERGIFTVRDFLGAFVESSPENVVEGNGKVKRKNVVRSWKNAHAFQELIQEFFDYKSGDKNGVKRPKLNMKAVTIPLSEEQLEIRDKLEAMYDARGEDDKPIPGAPLVSIGTQQLMNISPALVKRGNAEVWNHVENINPKGNKEFVERSPKLKYICDSIAGFYKAYEEVKPGDPIPGQLFFLPKGVEYMPEIKRYLVETKGIPPEVIEFLDTDSKGQKAKDPDMKAKGLSRFTEITKDFNNKNGKCKIIIGSDVIKEGVSLNRHTAVAYNSMIDWNPTTEVQKRGRHHRPGNELKDVMWVDVLMEDSIDSKLYQKQGEKIARINQVFEGSGDTAIDISDINPDELKLDLIRDPARKARLTLAEEAQKLNRKAREMQSQAMTYAGLSNQHEKFSREIASNQEIIDEDEAWLSEFIETAKREGFSKEEKIKQVKKYLEGGYKYGDSDYNKAWDYRRKTENIKAAKADIVAFKKKLEKVEYQMQAKGVTIDTIDSKAEKFQAEADKIYDEVARYKDPEEQKKLTEKFIKEGKKREKERIRTPLDDMVQNQVNDVLGMLGIKKVMKSIASEISNTRILNQAKITIFNFLKGRKNGTTV